MPGKEFRWGAEVCVGSLRGATALRVERHVERRFVPRTQA
jgi:Uri superfamily endonuclease